MAFLFQRSSYHPNSLPSSLNDDISECITKDVMMRYKMGIEKVQKLMLSSRVRELNGCVAIELFGDA